MKINKSLALILLALVFSNFAVPRVQAMKTTMRHARSVGDITQEVQAAWELLIVRNLARASLHPIARAVIDRLEERERNLALDAIALNQETQERARLIREGEDVREMSMRDVMERTYIRSNEGRLCDEWKRIAAERKAARELK
jgi:hypothetical protein